MQKTELFDSPFSRAYWRQAASEFRNTKMLVFAALMIAVRVALKSVSIPVAADLRIGVGFLVNAFGAMTFGPVVAIAAAAVSDTLGALLFPTGAYFFPFIFTEIAGSLIFALFLYRTKITVTKIIWSRFCIDFFVNIVLQTPIMYLYYQMMLGKPYAILNLERIVKNLVMLPIESVLLTVFLGAVVPPTRKLGLVKSDISNLKFTRRNIATLVVMMVVGAVAVGGYAWYSYDHTSLSASYTAQQRLARNEALGEEILAQHPEVDGETAVCIIESAYPKAFHPEVTYHVAVYQADLSGAEDPQALLTELRGLSKSKAAAREELTKLFDEDIVLTENATEPEKNREAQP